MCHESLSRPPAVFLYSHLHHLSSSLNTLPSFLDIMNDFLQMTTAPTTTALVKICPTDPCGPRIETVLQEWRASCAIPSHNHWVETLTATRQNHGCVDRQCMNISNFDSAHSIQSLHGFIVHFVTELIPHRVHMPSDREWGRLIDAMKAFHAFCVAREFVAADAEIQLMFQRLKKFKICGVPRNISRLGKDRWWEGLELQQAGVALDTVCNLTSANDIQMTLEQLGLGGSFEQEIVCGDEMSSMVAVEVRRDGWVLAKCEFGMNGDCHRANAVFLPLPPYVAKMGVKDMTISCIELGLRNGIWRPIEHGGVFSGNALPPTF